MNTHKRQRGVALLLVMIALIILTAMTADFMESNKVYLLNAVHHRDAVKAEYLAKSSVNLSRLLLSVQSLPMFKEALNFPFWQFADMMLEPFSSNAKEGSLVGEAIGFDLEEAEGLGLAEGEEFSVEIVDEESKLNLNIAANPDSPLRQLVFNSLLAMMEPEIYNDIFEGKDYRDDVDREQVVCEIFDWADPDEDNCLGDMGEESYYSETSPEYERKNAPYDSLEELHFVHGIGDDFWTAFVEPNPEDQTTRTFTVWGKGKVNVNTASAGTLVASLCMLATDQDGNNPCQNPYSPFVQNLVTMLNNIITMRTFFPYTDVNAFIKQIENPAEDPTMLFALAMSGATSVTGAQGVPIVNKKQATQMFTTKSQVFSIYGQGTVSNPLTGETKKRIHVVVDIDPKEPSMIDPSQSMAAAGGKVLYWRQD
ncbi:MAG: general secretion pathway protein GspK [Deltaproteobacteria bacterium]|nr:general secretion pathway protein GspK [Deltaproteobacteria bacterium]MBN2673466.1 general secretion pathway protein GspK [Deltaproteobacteria bacterium]